MAVNIMVSAIAISFKSRCRCRLTERWAKEAGMDCLALAACLMFPRYVPHTFLDQVWLTYSDTRLAFVTFSNNLLVLALRAMFTEFAVLMAVAAFCFGGFLYSLWT